MDNKRDDFSEFLKWLLTGETQKTVRKEVYGNEDAEVAKAKELATGVLGESTSDSEALGILSTALGIVLGKVLTGEPHAVIVPKVNGEEKGVINTFIGDKLTNTFSLGRVREVLQLLSVIPSSLLRVLHQCPRWKN